MLDQHHHTDEALRDLIRLAVDDLLKRTPAEEPIFQIGAGATTFLSYQNGRVRFIQDLKDTREDRDGHICLTCGEPLTPRLGEKNAKHFAHRAGSECSGSGGAAETVLHHTAVRLAAALGKVYLSESVMERSDEFPDIIEEAFSGGVLSYQRGVYEQQYPNSRFGYLPDVLAQLDGPFEGHPLLIEIHVTNPVSNEKRAQVGPDGDDVDMLEIHLDDLYRRAREEGLPISKLLVARQVRSEAPREWVHSRVRRILRNRVRRREVERRLRDAEKGLRDLTDRVPALLGGERLRSCLAREPDLPALTDWVRREERDHQELSDQLDGILKNAPKGVSLDRPIRSVSDLSGDALFRDIAGLLPRFEEIRYGETDLNGAIPALVETVRMAWAVLSGSDETDDRSVEAAETAQFRLRTDLRHATERLRALTGSAEALERGHEALSRAAQAARGAERLFRGSVIAKIATVERMAKGDARARDELLERQAKLKQDQEEWDHLFGEVTHNVPRLILGSSWVRYEPHPTLGAGQTFKEVNGALRALCEILKRREVPPGRLHEILQFPVPFLDGIRLHEALRYERSPDILEQLYEALAEGGVVPIICENRSVR